MRPFLVFLLAAGLGAAPPQLRILSADLVIGPGREPRPGDAPFRPYLEVEVGVTGLRPGTVPVFRLWRRTGAKLVRLRAESVAPEGPDRYRLLALGVRGKGPVVVELRIRGRRSLRAEAPIQVHALPSPRPRGGVDPRS